MGLYWRLNAMIIHDLKFTTQLRIFAVFWNFATKYFEF